MRPFSIFLVEDAFEALQKLSGEDRGQYIEWITGLLRTTPHAQGHLLEGALYGFRTIALPPNLTLVYGIDIRLREVLIIAIFPSNVPIADKKTELNNKVGQLASHPETVVRRLLDGLR